MMIIMTCPIAEQFGVVKYEVMQEDDRDAF